jgi:hypothetical protein
MTRLIVPLLRKADSMKKKDWLKLPKQEDVTEIDMGNMKASVVQLTDENRPAMVEVALSMYVGEKCKYCGHEYTSNEDLRARDVVYAGYHANGRTACKSCWDKNNP